MMIFATWSEMNEKAKEYELIGISSFYGIFCDDKDEEEKELRKSSFLSLLLDGVKTGRVTIHGEIQHLQDYIRIVGKGQVDEEHWEYGAKSSQRRKRWHTNTKFLWLEMFGLEKTEIDPVDVLEWMNQRSVRQKFLSVSISPAAAALDAGNATATKPKGGSKNQTNEKKATTAECLIVAGALLKGSGLDVDDKINRDRFTELVREAMKGKGQARLFHLTTAKTIFDKSPELRQFKRPRGRQKKK